VPPSLDGVLFWFNDYTASRNGLKKRNLADSVCDGDTDGAAAVINIKFDNGELIMSEKIRKAANAL
jgi:hypothetical protein